MIEITSTEDWLRCLDNYPVVPPGQTAVWEKSSYSKNHKILRFRSDVPGAIALQGTLKKQFPYPRFIVEDGPLIGSSCSEMDFLSFFTKLRTALGKSISIEISSIFPYQAHHEFLFRTAGFLRPLVSSSCPLTYRVQASPDKSGFSSNWRHNYNRSLKNNLSFEVIDTPNDQDIKDFLEIYNQTAGIKGMRCHFDHDTLRSLSKDQNMKFFFVNQNGRRDSARMIYCSKSVAFDFLAGTTADGRKNYASYFMIANILSYCSQNGLQTFDFGRIGPGRYDSIDNFKKGVGGTLVQYLGEWVSPGHEYLQFVFGLMRFIKRNERW